jgi:hypothetical protein
MAEQIISENEDCNEALRAFMDAEQSWPDAFFLSDHGNYHLIDLNEKE